MKLASNANDNVGTPITLPSMQQIWRICLPLGIIFWLIGFALWWQFGLDETILFTTNTARVHNMPIVVLSQWLTNYGMAVITGILLIYLLASKLINSLDAPLTVYFYTICSMGLSGIVGDLLKELFARPRPAITYADELLILSQSMTPSIPSGHTVKSIALALPFILLVPSNNTLHKIIKVVIAAVAVCVSFSRIMLGAHYVSDVVAGFGMAFLGLPFTMLFANMVLKQSKAEQLPFMSMIWGVLLVFLTFLFVGM